ncbi:MAG: hypothetical protein NZM25_05490 [Leptospiraceae bacterium]|nr:hypothetical protein [Leptospiraceae bacterium]MDW8306499.1 hypothetical protein [Leptospiraceae bacterium]
MRYFLTLTLLYTCFVFSPAPLPAQENAVPPSQDESAEEKKARKKRFVTLTEEDEAKPDHEQEEKERKLANPEIIETYLSARKTNLSFGELLFLNMLVGAFSGSIFGALSSLSQYHTNNLAKYRQNLAAFAGAGAAVGLLGGGGVALVEYLRKEYLVVGPVVLNYSWYGAMTGLLLGMLAGVIPYSQSHNTDHIWNFAGYGTMAGIGLGAALFFLQYPHNIQTQLSFEKTRTHLAIGWRF